MFLRRLVSLLKNLAARLPALLLGVASIGTVASPLGIWSSHLERMSHFRFWWIGLLALLVGFFLKRRQRLPTLAAAFVLAWATLPLLPYWLPPERTTSGEGLKVISWNLLWENPRKGEALPWLQAQNADVLVLTECTHEWRDRLAELSSVFPHHLSSGRDGAEGMWLLSRFPTDVPDVDGLASDKPWLSTIVHTPQGPVRLIGMHPRTPRSGRRFDERNAQYDRAAMIASSSEIPVVIAGDLNCTPFSPWFHRLLAQGKLRDTALGYGLSSTWQSNGIRLPIDHILASPSLHVLERRVHPDRMGSDHHPVIAVLAN